MKRFNRYVLIIILLIELICASNVKWGGQRWKEIIAFDGKGYYAYLPAIFIYHDLGFSFHDTIDKKYSEPRTYYEYRVKKDNGVIDKYFSGTALAELPFFLIAHASTIISGGTADGYSFLYQLSISLAAIFYGLTGLFFLRKILKIYSIPENIISFVLIVIALGTQLFNYTVFDPSMSHVYSFAMITAFIYFLKKYIDEEKSSFLILTGFLAGWIFLIRPVNGIIIFIVPFLAGNREIFIQTLKNVFRKDSGLIMAVILFLLTASIQGIIYLIQSGNFFADSYTVESFNWNKPEIINILFSYKKGLFIYTPVTFIALAGLIPIYRKSRFTFLSFLFFFLLITYVLSSWWNWWYGGSFSSRPYTEYLSLFALLLAILLSELKYKFSRILIYSTLVFCIILCQVQIYQYRYFVIHWDKMDKEHYWRVFMRIDKIIKQENPNADLLKK